MFTDYDIRFEIPLLFNALFKFQCRNLLNSAKHKYENLV